MSCVEYTNLVALHADLRACRKCATAGYFIGSTPIFSGARGPSS